jgi:hypothetical protein
MARSKNEIYLGRGGRVFGPITAAQFERMKENGELSRYTYWWNPERTDWEMVEAPPPDPTRAQPEAVLFELAAVCHDFRQTLVAGTLEQVDDHGCCLVSPDSRELPSFGADSVLTLNLADAKTGRALNVKTVLKEAWRRGQTWVYRLSWDKLPSL